MARTILLVDDNKTEQVFLAGLLKSKYEILLASGGEECLSLLETRYADISAILLDIMMPGMDGFEVLVRARNNERLNQIPIIVTTVISDEEAQIKALRLGANAVVTKPFNQTMLLQMIDNTISLCETSAIVNASRMDDLTGLYNRESFFAEVKRRIQQEKPGYYILSHLNIDHFKVINDQYGPEVGDCVLQHVAACLRETAEATGGVAARIGGDKFAILFPAHFRGSEVVHILHEKVTQPDCLNQPITVRVGRYVVDDKNLPAATMYDRAALAEASIQGMYDLYVAEYDDVMREQIIYEQQIINNMEKALKNGQFEPFFQPQYNHATGALIGAEALVRWRDPKDGLLIPTIKFIHVFERNGFIYEMDKYIWEQVCVCVRKWLDAGIKVVPVSVNISRMDIFHADFLEVITGLVEKYRIPVELLRLEITESAFSEAGEEIGKTVKQLLSFGFTVEIDDFGSGYSSLNTLKDVPAQILKLDMKFFEDSENMQRGGNIIESVVRMAKWLGMAVIAEGVEEKKQADYLKTIGCVYIQGYLYAKPMPLREYELVLQRSDKETALQGVETVKELDNNAFWDPRSMDTLIFNSYVGGACIFEYHNGKTELLRANDRYAEVLGCFAPENGVYGFLHLPKYLHGEGIAAKDEMLKAAIAFRREESCEVLLADPDRPERREYLRLTVRVIASTGERYLFYCGAENLTKQHEAERKERESAQRLSAIMSNMNAGVTALQISGDGTFRYIFSNDRFFEMFGYEGKHSVADKIDLFSHILPNDRKMVTTRAKQLIRHRLPVTVEFRCVKQDGTVINVRSCDSVTQIAGFEGDVVIANLYDITEEKELEEQLRFFSDTSHELLSVTETDSAIEEALRKTLQYFVAKRIYIFEIDYSNNTISNTYEVCAEGISEEKDNLQDFPLALYSRWIEEFQNRGYIDIQDVSALDDSVEKQVLLSQNIGALLAVPMMRGDVLLGFIGLDDPSAHKNMIKYLRSVGDHIELILNRQDMAEKLRNLEIDILDNIPCCVAVYEYDGEKLCPLHQNRHYRELLGCQTYYAGDESFFNMLLPEERQFAADEMKSAAEALRDAETELHLLCGNGEYRLFHAIGKVVPRREMGKYFVYGVYTPITDTASRAHDAIAEHLATAIENIGEGLTVVTEGENGLEYLFVNSRFYRTMGYSKEEFHRRAPQEVIHPDDWGHIWPAMRQLTAKDGPLTLQHRIIRQDGSIGWVQAIISVCSFSGVASSVKISIYSDISKQKRAEQIIRENSEQLRFLNESAHAILTQPDCDLAINETLRKMIGYFTGEFAAVFEYDRAGGVSRNTYEVCADGVSSRMERLQAIPIAVTAGWQTEFLKNKFVVIPDVNALDDSEAVLRKMLLEQGIRAMIASPIFRDGELIGYMSVNNPSKAVDQMPKIRALADYIAILLTRRDLNQKIEQEQNSMLTLMNDTPAGFCRMAILPDASPAIVYANEGLCRILRTTREKLLQACAQNAYAMIAPEDLPQMKADAMPSLRDGGEFNTQGRLLRGDGTLVWTMVFGRFTVADDGKMFLNTYFMDMTDKMSEEEKRKELLDNLPFGAALYEFDGEKLTAHHRNRQYWEQVFRRENENHFISVLNSVHPDDRAIIRQEIELAIREKRNGSCDARILYGENEYRPFHITGRIVAGEDGRYLIYTAFAPIVSDTFSYQEMLPVALSAIMSASPDMAFVKDQGFRYVSVSPTTVAAVGFADGKDMLGKTDYELFDKTTADKLYEEDRRVFESGKPIINDRSIVPDVFNQGKTERYAVTSKYPLLNGFGNVIGIYGTSHDITAQVEQESRLKLLTDSMPGGLVSFELINGELRTLYISEGFYPASGYSREDYAALTSDDPLALIHEEDRGKILEMIKKRTGTGSVGDVFECQCRFRVNNGSYRWNVLRGRLTQTAGGSLVLNGVFLDIDNSKKMQCKLMDQKKKMSALIATMPGGMFAYRADTGEFAFISEGVYDSLGYTQREFRQKFRNRFSEMIWHEDREAALEKIKADIEQNGKNGECEYRIEDKNGKLKWVLSRVHLITGGEGKNWFVVVILDISERKTLETMLDQENQYLQELAQTDPLTGVMTRAAFSEKVDAVIRAAGDGVQHALLMLDIDYFKQVNDTFGHSAGDQTLIEIAASLRSVLRHGDLVARLGGDEFVALLEDVPSVEIVRNKAEQICGRIHKTFNAEVEISASIGIAVSPKDGVTFDQLYKKADSALYSVKNAGKSSYAFYRDSMTGDYPETLIDCFPTDPERESVRKHRMLVVDDNEMEHAVMSKLFAEEFEIDNASDGGTALGCLRRYGAAISVVLLDLMMPGVDGFSVLKRMQESPELARIPVVVVSGAGDRETCIRAIRAGAADFVTKPFDPDVLRVRVNAAVDKMEIERLRTRNNLLECRNSENAKLRALLKQNGIAIPE